MTLKTQTWFIQATGIINVLKEFTAHKNKEETVGGNIKPASSPSPAELFPDAGCTDGRLSEAVCEAATQARALSCLRQRH